MKPRRNATTTLGGASTTQCANDMTMKYADGQEVRVGDHVGLGADDGGVVVCSIEDGAYSDEHTAEQWGYLKTGFMVEFPTYGLIHYEVAEEGLRLIARASQ